MMKLNFDSQFNPEPWTVVLCHRSLDKIGILHNITDMRGSFNLNSAQEISFTLHKELNNTEEVLWNEVYNLRVIWIKELNCYFQIEVEITDSKTDNIKNITATSLCEAELSQIMLNGIEINTEEDSKNYYELHEDEEDTYQWSKFWDREHPEFSLLTRILKDKAPHYTVKHVDDSLADLQRSFSIDGTSIYDWLTGECSEQFDCIFEFDSSDRSISVYDLFSVCRNDSCSYYLENGKRYRKNFLDFCPKCGSRNITSYGHDTNIIIDKNNLTEEVQLSTDVDSIKNTFRLVAGDDSMTAAVTALNPNGSQYLYYFADESLSDMSPQLVQKIHDYEALQESYRDEYEQLTEDHYNLLDNIYYLDHTKMPVYEKADLNAQTELDAIISNGITSIGVETFDINKVTNSFNVNNAERAVKSYASVSVRTGYFKVEVISDTTFGTNGYNSSTHKWRGKIKITSYSTSTKINNGTHTEEYDVAESSMLTISFFSSKANPTSYEQFLNQRCEIALATDNKNQKDLNVFRILKPDITVAYFTSKLNDYCRQRLKGFKESIEACIDVMLSYGITGADNNSDDLKRAHTNVYTPYKQKLDALEAKISELDEIIGDKEATDNVSLYGQLNNKNMRMNEIHSILNFENYLGETLYHEFCSYRREDTYQNDNFVSDWYVESENTAEIFKAAKEFIELANEQIRVSANYQHSISTNLYNLLIMPEFASITNNFELGNFIRVRVEDEIYRLRLIHYEVDFSDLSTLNTEFSDMTKTGNSLNDVRSILDSAQQMATSFGYTAKQAEKGTFANNTLEQFRKEGLESALYNVKNNTNEEVTLDHNGITAKAWDDITESYLDKQLRITHNIMVFTEDNWKTAKMAMGNFNYYDAVVGRWKEGYGVNADFVVSGYIQGTDIVGGNIYSPIIGSGVNAGKHMTHIDLEKGELKMGLDPTGATNQYTVTYEPDNNKFTVRGGTIEGGTIIGAEYRTSNNAFTVSSNGYLTATSGKIGGFNIVTNALYSDTEDNNYIELNSYSREITISSTNGKMILSRADLDLYRDQSFIGSLGIQKHSSLYGIGLICDAARYVSLGYYTYDSNANRSIHSVLVVNNSNNDFSWNESLIINDDMRMATSEKIYFTPSLDNTTSSIYIGPLSNSSNNKCGLSFHTKDTYMFGVGDNNSFMPSYPMSINKNSDDNSAYFYGNVYFKEKIKIKGGSIWLYDSNNSANKISIADDDCFVISGNTVVINSSEFSNPTTTLGSTATSYELYVGDKNSNNKSAYFKGEVCIANSLYLPTNAKICSKTNNGTTKSILQVDASGTLDNIDIYSDAYWYLSNGYAKLSGTAYDAKKLCGYDSNGNVYHYVYVSNSPNGNLIPSERNINCGTNEHPFEKGVSYDGWVKQSDKKLKNHIKYLSEDINIEKFFMNLKPVEYILKEDELNRLQLGFYAQDIHNSSNYISDNLNIVTAYYKENDQKCIDPDSYDDKDLGWTLDYDSLVAPTVAMVQKQQREIETLKNEIEMLKEMINK